MTTLRVTNQTKNASVMVYLLEELSDARMRCDQLLRYVEKATKLIEKSPRKDHIFEVAGDVIRGIPETSFKLHKALQAVALAANRIDYEEIKQDLRPEKVDELERVLKDVRIRQVQRRSLPMMNPGNVVNELKSLARKARVEGEPDTAGLGALIGALEMGAPKQASDAGAKVATQFEAMAHALENPPEGEIPSRCRLAQVLRRTLGDHLDVSMVGGATQYGQERIANASLDPNVASDLHRLDRHADSLSKSGKDIHHAVDLLTRDPQKYYPQLENLGSYLASVGTSHRVMERSWESLSGALASRTAGAKSGAQLPESIVTEIQAAIDLLKKLAKGAGTTKRQVFGVISGLALVVQKMGQDELISSLLQRAAKAVQSKWSPSQLKEVETNEKTASKLPEEAVTEIQAVIVQLKKLSKGAGNTKRLMIGVISGLALAVKSMGQDETIYNLLDRSAAAIQSKWSSSDLKDIANAEESEGGEPDETSSKTASLYDDKLSGYEEGKSADPTENMSEPDAKEWKANTEKHKDKFKKEADIVRDPKKVFARMKEAVDSLLEARVRTRRVTDDLQDIMNDASGVAFTDNYNNPVIRKVRDELNELDHTIGMAFRNIERLEKDMQSMVVGRTASGDEDRRSRFEEGKSADPTESMSDADAKEWKANTEEHKDKFKGALNQHGVRLAGRDEKAQSSKSWKVP